MNNFACHSFKFFDKLFLSIHLLFIAFRKIINFQFTEGIINFCGIVEIIKLNATSTKLDLKSALLLIKISNTLQIKVRSIIIDFMFLDHHCGNRLQL